MQRPKRNRPTLNLDALAELNVDRRRLRDHLRIAESTLSLKLSGHRPWSQTEIELILDLARTLGSQLTYESLFQPRHRPRGRKRAAA